MSEDSRRTEDSIPNPGVEHLVYETPWIDFFYDDIVHPDGTPGKYAWVRNHSDVGGVMIIPVTPSGKFLLIKSYRHPNKRYFWEFPAGVMDVGETPDESARRELTEETGLVATRIEFLGSQSPIGYSGSLLHSVLAEIPEITVDDLQLQTEESIVDAKLLTQEEVIELIDDEEVGSGPTLMCLARYWMWQKKQAAGQQEQA